MDVELHSASNYVTTLLKNTTTISNFKLKKFNIFVVLCKIVVT